MNGIRHLTKMVHVAFNKNIPKTLKSSPEPEGL